MNKLILTALLGTFISFFSGKPASSKCGATVEINGPNTGLVTRVEIQNLKTNITTTYNNPTFPLYYLTNSGPLFQAKYFLNSSIHFVLYATGPNGECSIINYHPASQGDLTFTATCGYDYSVNCVETAYGDDWSCF